MGEVSTTQRYTVSILAGTQNLQHPDSYWDQRACLLPGLGNSLWVHTVEMQIYKLKAATWIQINRLYMADARLEIELIAFLPKGK
jgi:hypothetical protein